jgi:hypothetical protein
VSIGKVEILCCYPYSRVEVFVLSINFVGFRNGEEDLNNDLRNTKEKVRSLEVTHREVEAGAKRSSE